MYEVIWSAMDEVDHRAECSSEDFTTLGQPVSLSCPITFFDLWGAWIGKKAVELVPIRSFLPEEREELLQSIAKVETLILKYIKKDVIHMFQAIEVGGRICFFPFSLPLQQRCEPKPYEDIRESFLFRVHKTSSTVILDEHRALMRSAPIYFEREELLTAMPFIELPSTTAEPPENFYEWRLRMRVAALEKMRIANAQARARYNPPPQVEEFDHTQNVFHAANQHISAWKKILPELKKADLKAAKLAIEKWQGKNHRQAFQNAFPGEPSSNAVGYVGRARNRAEKLARKYCLKMPPWQKRTT